jgi:hypothetical protein
MKARKSTIVTTSVRRPMESQPTDSVGVPSTYPPEETPSVNPFALVGELSAATVGR